MRAVVLCCAVLLLLLSSAALCSAAPYLLSDLESDADFAAWSATGFVSNCPDLCTPQPSTLTRVASHATEGTSSCQIDMPVGDYEGMERSVFPTNNWSAYNRLYFDLENPTSNALTLHIEVSDTVHGTGWLKRYLFDKALVPGVNHITMPLQNLLLNDGSAYLDLAHIYNFNVTVDGHTEPTTVYFDNMRLDYVQDNPDADAARNIWKFDFGPGDARSPDFFACAAGTVYPLSSSRPFGWTGGPYRYSGDFGGPDDLCRDFVRALCCPDPGDGSTLNFRLDVPNGTYHVWVIARSNDLSEMPVNPYKIIAEGVTKVDVPMNSGLFYSTDCFYRGMNEDYPFSGEAWEMFENTNFPVYQFTTTVSDGHLDIDFDHAWAYAMIVYPDTPAIVSEMTTRLAGIEAERRAQFDSNYYINSPASVTFTPTPEETARGYAVWPASLMDVCYPDTLPPDPRPTLALSTFAAQGESRPVSVAIRPLGDITGVSVECTDLSDGLGHTIANTEVEAEYLRYMATGDTEFFGAGVLSWKPRLLQKDFPIHVPTQVTKQLWLTIHVPADTPAGAYNGTVTVHASSGDVTLPLTVQVYGFALDPADDEAYGWYYNPPESQYDMSTRWFPDLAAQPDVLLRQDLALMKEHGFNSLQFPGPSIIVSGGHVTGLNASALERYVAAMQEVGFGGNWWGQTGTLGFADQIMNAGYAEFSATFNTCFKEALQRTIDWGQTPAGTPLVFYLVDEPRETGIQPWNRNFADSMQYAALANQVPDAVSTITVMADSGGGVDYTPFADALDFMQTHPWPNSDGLILGAYNQGKPNWFYNTGGDLRLVYGFYQYRYGGGNGAWEWHYDWLDGDMFDTFPYSPFNNHWRYVYPSPDGPVPTLNFELASLGITDYRYASTLSRMASQARASGLPELMTWADQAEALLLVLKADTPAFAVDNGYRPNHFAGVTGPNALALAEAAMEDYRQQIAARIAALPFPIPTSSSQVMSTSLPAAMEWESTDSGSVTIRNLESTTWAAAGGYQLYASQGVDRWSLLSVPLATDLAPMASRVFNLDLTAPPVTTLSYPLPVTPTTTAAVDGLPLLMVMSHGTDPLSGGMVSQEITISRFPDIQPSTAGAWARFYVEECAGRVPLIVGGYDDGTYRPTLPVDRGAMAVFMARALGLDLPPYQGRFSDVPEEYWAAGQIEALAGADIVGGYSDGTYRPTLGVARDAMAVFVARGIAGGDGNVPDGPVTPSFSDVPTIHWAYKYVEYARSHGVVGGYSDGTYRPIVPVTRDQMAVFVYRAFLQPTGSAVVLAGPAVTAADPAASGVCGWASNTSRAVSDPGYAYIALDAVRLDTNLTGPDSFFAVFFELRSAAAPTAPAVGPYRYDVSISGPALAAAKAEATSTGHPHYALSWDIPAGLAPGSYLLVVSVEDPTGEMREVARKPAFIITP